MLLCCFKLCTERCLNRGKKPNAEMNLSSKLSHNYLWAVLDVFPVVVYEKLDAFLGTSVHYIATYSKKNNTMGLP